jgi:hypothetical protein
MVLTDKVHLTHACAPLFRGWVISQEIMGVWQKDRLPLVTGNVPSA